MASGPPPPASPSAPTGPPDPLYPSGPVRQSHPEPGSKEALREIIARKNELIDVLIDKVTKLQSENRDLLSVGHELKSIANELRSRLGEKDTDRITPEGVAPKQKRQSKKIKKKDEGNKEEDG